jgi:fatty acid desaturase
MGMRRPLSLTAHHAVRALAFGVLVASPAQPVALAAAFGLFFTLFAFHHDVMHGALGLGRRTGEALLAVLGCLIMTSGHGTRRLHMRHHAHPLAENDLEGEGARLGWFGAIVTSPLGYFRMHLAGFEGAGARERRVQWFENAVVVILAGLLATHALPERVRLYGLVAAAMQLTAGFWASHVPHRAPAWLTRTAARLSFLQSPVLLSLAFHELHHQKPKVPCHELALSGR